MGVAAVGVAAAGAAAAGAGATVGVAVAARSVAIAGRRDRSLSQPTPEVEFGEGAKITAPAEEAPVSPEAAARRVGLERLAAAEGLAWASFLCAELRAQGRSIAGGWPGTISEARRRVRVCTSDRRGGSVSGSKSAAGLSAVDLEWLTRTAYLAAKAEWRAQLDPDADE